MSMTDSTTDETRRAFEAWAFGKVVHLAKAKDDSYRNDSAAIAWLAWNAARAAALEEAAQIADAEASVEGIAQRIAEEIRERAKT